MQKRLNLPTTIPLEKVKTIEEQYPVYLQICIAGLRAEIATIVLIRLENVKC